VMYNRTMTDLELAISKLNPQQKLAVETLEGPVLVIAGPGTGKTQMLTLRIANILQSRDVAPQNILCLTYSEAGVAAMKKRLSSFIGAAAYNVKIHTFHSFCNEVIGTFPEKFIKVKELNRLDDLTRVKIIKQIIDELPEKENGYKIRPFYEKYKYQGSLLDSFKTLKMEGIFPDDFVTLTQEIYTEIEANPRLNKKTGKPTSDWYKELESAQKNTEVATVYKRYVEKLEEEGLYDYEDMILFVIKAFREDDALLSHYQEKFLYMLVDEYQDTNGSQNMIIKLLGSFDKSPNIFAVGDDDQAIYRFQGANVQNLLDFTTMFENVKPISVAINYRSTQLILDAASNVIKKNANRLSNHIKELDKDLKAGVQSDSYPIELYEFDNSDMETAWVVKKIKELLQKGVNPSEIAVMFRNNKDSVALIEQLEKEKIPFDMHRGGNALEEKVVKQFIQLIKLLNVDSTSGYDNQLFVALNYNFLEIEEYDLFLLNKLRKETRMPFLELIKELTEEQIARFSSLDKIESFLEKVFKFGKEIKNDTLYNVLQWYAEDIGFSGYLLRSDEFSLEDINAFSALLKYIRSLNRADSEMSIEDLLQDLELMKENNIGISEPGLETKQEAVVLRTAHSSKGLEFEHVFIINCVDKKWGNQADRKIIKLPKEIYFRSDEALTKEVEETSIEDERRLFFVALTRAKSNVYISYARMQSEDTEGKEKLPSQFISEIDSSYIKKVPTNDLIEVTKETLLNINKKERVVLESDKARDFIKSELQRFKMSASALNEFLECPKKFFYRRILQIPEPFEKALVLGTGVHSCLESYFRVLKNGEKMEAAFMISELESSLKKQLVYKDLYQEILDEGTIIIQEYCKEYESGFVAPLEVEYNFGLKNINLEVDGISIPLSGKVDKIEEISTDELGNHIVRVIDYKTSAPKTEGQIRGSTKDSKGEIFNQLVFYKLLGDLDSSFSDSKGKKYIIQEACVDFLKKKDNKFSKISLQITDEDVEELKTKISAAYKSILNLEFNGSDAYPLCTECEYCSL
jgi:DNA helicase-2/ATP-dependent DNA helicase PcrA